MTDTPPTTTPSGDLPPGLDEVLTLIETETGRTFSKKDRRIVANLVERYPELLNPSTPPARLAAIVEQVRKGETLTGASGVDLLAGTVEKKGSLWAQTKDFLGPMGPIDEAVLGAINQTFTQENPVTEQAKEDAKHTPTNVLAKLLEPDTSGRYQNMLTANGRTGTVTGATSGKPPGADAGSVGFSAQAQADEEAAFRRAIHPQSKSEADAELNRIIRTGGTDFDVFSLEPVLMEGPDGQKVPLTYVDERGVKRPIRDVEDPNLVPWDTLSSAARQTRDDTQRMKAEAMKPRQPTGKGPTRSDYDRLKAAERGIALTGNAPMSAEYAAAQAELTQARSNVKRATTGATSFGSRQAFEANEEYLRQRDMPSAWSDVDSISVNALLDKPWLMSPEELTRLQVKLFEGGAYEDYGGLRYDPKKPLSAQIRLGDANDPTFKAVWRRFGNETMGDRSKTWMNHLETRRSTYKPILDYERDLAAKQAAEEAASKIRKFTLTDPAAIRERGRQLGPEIGGRRLTPEEEAAVIEFIHARETSLGQAQTDPAVAGAIVDVDVDAELAEAIRGHMGVEADANDMAQQYITFTDLLRGPGR